MRGTPDSLPKIHLTTRFIPAHAGNTSSMRILGRLRAVHPRACGEHCSTLRRRTLLLGSSPRMRGTHPLHLCQPPVHRFIPAHAGNTTAVPSPQPGIAVHPRACGEHATGGYKISEFTGSSPRMRGTRCKHEHPTGRGRFIPAHAGNTRSPAIPSAPSAVHPRACGEHYLVLGICMNDDGSSPRMRGTPAAALSNFFGTRFIPAHAGNTSECEWRYVHSAVHPRACGEHCS